MRNIFSKMPLAAAAFVFAAALAVTACGGNGAPGGGGLGETLTLSGRVYTVGIDWQTMGMTYTPVTGDLAVTILPQVGTGQIAAGQLNLTLGTPTAAQMGRISAYLFGSGWDNVTITPDDALSAQPWFNTPDGDLVREYNRTTISGTTLRTTGRSVRYVFVDRDVAVRGTGTTNEEDGFRYTTRSFNFTLRKGWNALHLLTEGSINVATETANVTMTLSLSNPGSPLRWVILDDGDWDDWEFSSRIRR